jgi:hypothetical protein
MWNQVHVFIVQSMTYQRYIFIYTFWIKWMYQLEDISCPQLYPRACICLMMYFKYNWKRVLKMKKKCFSWKNYCKLSTHICKCWSFCEYPGERIIATYVLISEWKLPSFMFIWQCKYQCIWNIHVFDTTTN